MTHTRLVLFAALVLAAPAFGQTARVASKAKADTVATSDSATTPAPKKERIPRYEAPAIEIQHIRAYDQRGLNVFESPKDDRVPFSGYKIQWGGAFTQQYQNLTHANTAAPKVASGVNQNELYNLGQGFNNAVANLYLNGQLAQGIRVTVEFYPSARHHQEMWVKDGYFLIDGSPIENPILDKIMQYATLKVGHYEVNFGDQHFRRSDNGQTIYNPFVGNLIMDDMTTEIGAEAYLRTGPWLAMFGVTNGETRGTVSNPGQRGPSWLGKVGYDNKFSDDLRIRLTGSLYKKDRGMANALTSGDRGGSRYYDVMENTTSTESANAWSGNIQSGMKSIVTAFVINPQLYYNGLEIFGNIETHTGAAATEASRRTIRQLSTDILYRFADNKLYVGGRQNSVSGQLPGIANDISVQRSQLGGGWYVTPNVLAKLEWVTQKYRDFPTTDIRSGGQFKGIMIEGAVAF